MANLVWDAESSTFKWLTNHNHQNIYWDEEEETFTDESPILRDMRLIKKALRALDTETMWKYKIKYRSSSTIMRIAIDISLDAVKMLHHQGWKWDEYCCQSAAVADVNILRYLHEHGCSWDYFTPVAAITAYRGLNMESLRYAMENGCPRNKLICDCAISQGYLECLKYLRSIGCLWSHHLCNHGALRNQPTTKTLKYFHENAGICSHTYISHEYSRERQGTVIYYKSNQTVFEPSYR